MYGSSFMFATLRPRFSMSAPIDADTMPLPSDETTPPVTNTNLVCCAMDHLDGAAKQCAPGGFYRLRRAEARAEITPPTEICACRSDVPRRRANTNKRW